MKKNVWIMNHYAGNMPFEKGGRHYKFADYLVRAGYVPTVFCCNNKHNPSTEMFYNTDKLWQVHVSEEIAVPFVYIRARTYRGNGKQRILNMLDFFCNLKKTAKEYALESGKPDVILASSVHPLTMLAGIQLAKQFGVKCICEVRDLWPESIVVYGVAGPGNPAVIALRWLEKWIYKKADALVFTMEGAYDYILEQGWQNDVPREKVHFINNGVDLEQFRENRESCRVEDEDLDNPDLFKVVYAGSIRKANNMGLLLDVAKEIHDPRVKFLIWGAGDQLPALQQRLLDEKITNVVFKGRVDKTYVPYIACKANLNYLDPFTDEIARYGISSNKLFEYFAAEKPILMGISGKHNPAEDYGCGIICKPEKDSLLSGLNRVLAMEQQEYCHICRCAKQAAQDYSFSNLTDKLIGIIEQV